VNQRLSRPTYLYVIGAPGSTTVKIGMTNDPDKRLQQIQCMCPIKLHLIWARPAPYQLERALHRHFAAQRSHGEWFTFEEDPLPLIQAAISSGLDQVAIEASPKATHVAQEEDVPEMSVRARLMLESLRETYFGVWFPLEEAAQRIGFSFPSMRDGLDELAELGKVTRGPERRGLDWLKREYALVHGVRA
jgi:hypothetical protein